MNSQNGYRQTYTQNEDNYLTQEPSLRSMVCYYTISLYKLVCSYVFRGAVQKKNFLKTIRNLYEQQAPTYRYVQQRVWQLIKRWECEIRVAFYTHMSNLYMYIYTSLPHTYYSYVHSLFYVFVTIFNRLANWLYIN